MIEDNPDIAEATHGLALALVASSSAPLLLLNGEMTVIAASESFCRAFEIEPASAPGLTLSSLGNGEWDAPQLRSLLRTTVAGNAEIGAYEMDLEREGHDARRLVLNARRLDYAGASEVRVVLAVIDVTEARLAERVKDDLLRVRISVQ